MEIRSWEYFVGDLKSMKDPFYVTIIDNTSIYLS